MISYNYDYDVSKFSVHRLLGLTDFCLNLQIQGTMLSQTKYFTFSM